MSISAAVTPSASINPFALSYVRVDVPKPGRV